MVSDITAYIPLIESIPHWHGDVDAIEHAFIVKATLDELLCTAIPENQWKKGNILQCTSVDDMLNPQFSVTEQHLRMTGSITDRVGQRWYWYKECDIINLDLYVWSAY